MKKRRKEIIELLKGPIKIPIIAIMVFFGLKWIAKIDPINNPFFEGHALLAFLFILISGSIMLIFISKFSKEENRSKYRTYLVTWASTSVLLIILFIGIVKKDHPDTYATLMHISILATTMVTVMILRENNSKTNKNS